MCPRMPRVNWKADHFPQSMYLFSDLDLCGAGVDPTSELATQLLIWIAIDAVRPILLLLPYK